MASLFDKLKCEEERALRHDEGVSSFFQVETVTKTGGYSADDPAGREISRTTSYENIPARVVLSPRERRIRVDGGQYIYRRADMILQDIPLSFYSSLERAKLIRVLQHSEAGDTWQVCEVIEIVRSSLTNTLTIYCTATFPSQE